MEYGLVLVWWLLFQALLLAGLPLAARLFPFAPDRGASLALPLALVAVGVTVFWIGHVSFGPATVLGSVLLLLVAAGIASRGGVDVPWARYAEVVAVFTAAFLFLVAIRSVDAGAVPGGGEKFLDMGLLQSLLRADRLPPGDMWFAGERVIYYYGGHLLAAVEATLTDTPGRYAYNLALAGFYAMEVTAAYGLAGTIAADRDYPRAAAGAFAALLFGLASNLRTPIRVLATAFLPPAAVRSVADAFDFEPEEAVIVPGEFSYWPASRVIEGTINEFPFFAYLNGDLHAHMMSVAFLFLVVGVLYAYYRTPAAARRRRLALLLLALPPCVGVLTMVNTWSLPTALGLTVLTVAAADAEPWTLLGGGVDRDRSRTTADRSWAAAEPARVLAAGAVAAVVGALALLWIAPFVAEVLLAGVGRRHVAFLPKRSGLGAFLVVHGAFLAVFWSSLAGAFGLTPRRAAAVAAGFVALALAGWALNLVGLALVGPLVLAGWYLLRRTDRASFGTLLVVAGAGLVVLVEFAYLKDMATSGRMNTVFKTYFEVWALWSVAAGVALAGFCARARTWVPRVSPDRRPAVGVAVAVLVLSAVAVPYPVLALSEHVAHGNEPTLDAVAFTHETHPYEAEAIEWFLDREGRPHIVSRPGWAVYTWRNPVSSLTGVPTVAGWSHERIYRGADAYQARVREVNVLYRTDDPHSRAVLLDKYDVRYIYYGPLEREKYGDVRFADEPGISVAFRNEKVTIYAVNRSVWA